MREFCSQEEFGNFIVRHFPTFLSQFICTQYATVAQYIDLSTSIIHKQNEKH